MVLRKSGEKYLLECTVIPKSREEKIVGVVADTLKVKLTAPPADGKANKQLGKLLAKEFRIPVGSITIVKGVSSRHKTIALNASATFPDYLASYLS